MIQKNNNKKFTKGHMVYSSMEIIETEQEIYTFEDGDIFTVNTYSVFPQENIDGIYLMNLYGQKIYNKNCGIQEKRI